MPQLCLFKLFSLILPCVTDLPDSIPPPPPTPSLLESILLPEIGATPKIVVVFSFKLDCEEISWCGSLFIPSICYVCANPSIFLLLGVIFLLKLKGDLCLYCVERSIHYQQRILLISLFTF